MTTPDPPPGKTMLQVDAPSTGDMVVTGWRVIVGDPAAPTAVHGPYDDVRVAMRVAWRVNAHPDRMPGAVWARLAPAGEETPAH